MGLSELTRLIYKVEMVIHTSQAMAQCRVHSELHSYERVCACRGAECRNILLLGDFLLFFLLKHVRLFSSVTFRLTYRIRASIFLGKQEKPNDFCLEFQVFLFLHGKASQTCGFPTFFYPTLKHGHSTAFCSFTKSLFLWSLTDPCNGSFSLSSLLANLAK